MSEYLFYLDIFGTVSFAVAASLMAYKKNLDPFGIFVISMITAVGGGTLRDILLRNYPVFWIEDITYLMVVVVSSLLTQIFIKYISRISNILLIFDAIGIGIFTIIGIKTSLNFHLHPLISITMGTITAVFGGLIRDVLYNELPVILHKELYATLCILGGGVFFILKYFAVPLEANYAVSMLFIIITRIIAIKYNLSLKSFT